MYNGLLHLHNLLRWVILLLLVIAIVKSFAGMNSNKPLTNGDKKVGLFLMISAHIQLLIGLYQWLAGRYGIFTSSIPEGMSVMKDKFFRFYMIEHPLAMLIATILITVGRGQAKKSISDTLKHKRAFWFYFIALILILAAVPWPFREIVARPWFPGAGN
jgi:protein-S-isoprenylcysteine O-methyltransferase Ste14